VSAILSHGFIPTSWVSSLSCRHGDNAGRLFQVDRRRGPARPLSDKLRSGYLPDSATLTAALGGTLVDGPEVEKRALSVYEELRPGPNPMCLESADVQLGDPPVLLVSRKIADHVIAPHREISEAEYGVISGLHGFTSPDHLAARVRHDHVVLLAAAVDQEELGLAGLYVKRAGVRTGSRSS
jgi:hypothetical protein